VALGRSKRIAIVMISLSAKHCIWGTGRDRGVKLIWAMSTNCQRAFSQQSGVKNAHLSYGKENRLVEVPNLSCSNSREVYMRTDSVEFVLVC